MSSAAKGLDESLPLQGYRVLDMTRVLAGVSLMGFNDTLFLITNISQALLHADIGRPRVRLRRQSLRIPSAPSKMKIK